MRVLAIALAFLPFFAVAAFPQGSTNEQFLIAADRTIDRLVDEFREVMNPDERDILDETDIRIDRFSNDVVRVYANIENGKRVIVISRGFMAAGDLIDWALTYEIYVAQQQQVPVNSERIIKYTNVVAEIILNNAHQRSRALPVKDIPYYLQWTGMGEDQYNEVTDGLRRDPDFQNLRALIKLHAFALILGHELGHHVLGHLESSERSVRQEEEADAYGVKLEMKAGYMPLMSASSFLLFSAFEGWSTNPGTTHDHPYGVCRLFHLADASIKSISDDTDFLEYIEENGKKDQFDAWVAQIHAISPEAKHECDQ